MFRIERVLTTISSGEITMKICTIEFSGTGAMVQYDFHMCRELSRAGAEVTLVTSNNFELRNLKHDFRIVELFSLWDAHRDSLHSNFLRKLRRVFRAAVFMLAWFRILNFVRREKPD